MKEEHIIVSNAPLEKETPATIDRYYAFEYWGYSVSTIPLPAEQEIADEDILYCLENAGQLDFWKTSEEDIYTISNGEEFS